MARRKNRSKATSVSEEEDEGGIDNDVDVSIAAAAEPVSAKQLGYGEFEIDIEEVLKQTLPIAFAAIEAAPLTKEIADGLPLTKGAYILFLDGHMVYAGKTDTRHGFYQRLGRHVDSVRHRVGLDPVRMTFKSLRIMVFSALDAEAILIAKMREMDPTALLWNDSGFGSNDPGRKRDDGEPPRFDRDFPVDIDFQMPPMNPIPSTLGKLLLTAKKSVPYLLRHVRLTAALNDIPVLPMEEGWTMRRILRSAMDVLPEDFQVTIFHGRVIMYREDQEYEFAREVMRGRA